MNEFSLNVLLRRRSGIYDINIILFVLLCPSVLPRIPYCHNLTNVYLRIQAVRSLQRTHTFFIPFGAL